ncbi:hypothetical protein BJV82DRAFT_592621 [Fennellomyces sp. T-0311]|nr:hypothetical protein BJV82DRAFT_592621 [Fennellomyces sp. T-0311]
MLHAISSFLGISHISKTFKNSWKQVRGLREIKKEYKNSLLGSGTVHGTNDSDITTRVEAYANVPFTTRNSDPETARRQWILHHYATLVLALKRQEEKVMAIADDRMRTIASTPIVLCAVGFIPSCIASLGNLFDDDSVSTDYEYDQFVVGILLIALGIWCSISILQTILFYRIIPSFLHRKVLGKLVKRHKKSKSVDIYQRNMLEQFKVKEEIDAGTVDSCWRQAEDRKLHEAVLGSTRWVVLIQLIYPLHDLINWLTYPVMLLLQILILAFLWWLPKNSDYDTSMRGQNMFSVWIFVLNFILSLSSTAPSSGYDQDDHTDDRDRDLHS